MKTMKFLNCKTCSLALFLVLYFWAGTKINMAQEKPNHPKTHYTAPDGKLYWNMDLPVYLSISSSPQGEKQALLYKGREKVPFYFTVEGLNYLKTPWAVDKETKKTVYPKQTVNFPIYADGSAPRVSHKFPGAKSYESGKELFFAENVQFSLTAQDKYSGTLGIFINTGQQEFTRYADTLKFTKAGATKISYYAADNVGNTSRLKQISFTIDPNPPTSRLEAENCLRGKENVFSNKSRIKIDAQDDYSGVKSIFFRINQEKTKLYTGPVSFKNYETGEFTILYYSIDNVGNKEDEQSYSFYLDKSPPMVISRIVGDVYEIGDKTFFSGRTQLQLTAFDNKAGVERIMYSVDGSEYKPYEDKALYLSTEAGRHSIKYYAVDSTGNSSADSKRPNEYDYVLENYYIDLTGPEITYAVSGPSLKTDEKLILSPESLVKIEALDPESGVKNKAFSFNNEIKEREYAEGIPLDELDYGDNYIGFIAYDNVNNRNIGDLKFFMDNQSPEIMLQFGSEQIGTQEDLPVYPSYTSIFVAANDKETGIDKIMYSLNGADSQPYRGRIENFKPEARNTLEITVTDLLENESRKTVEFFVK